MSSAITWTPSADCVFYRASSINSSLYARSNSREARTQTHIVCTAGAWVQWGLRNKILQYVANGSSNRAKFIVHCASYSVGLLWTPTTSLGFKVLVCVLICGSCIHVSVPETHSHFSWAYIYGCRLTLILIHMHNMTWWCQLSYLKMA